MAKKDKICDVQFIASKVGKNNQKYAKKCTLVFKKQTKLVKLTKYW